MRTRTPRPPFPLTALLAGLLIAGCAAPAGPVPASAAPVSAAPTSTATATTAPSTSAPPSPGGSLVGGPPPPTVAGAPDAAAAPVVVVDPGHNGGNAADPRAVNREVPDGRGGTKPCNTTGTATNAGYPEHAFTFDVARRVVPILERAGVRVVLTRPDDAGVGPCVDERGRAGAAAGAAAVVSVHADGSGAGNSGFHVAYSAPPLNDAQAGPALDLATDLRDAFRVGGFPDSDYIGDGALSPRSDLAGLNHATVPTVVVECANMRNPGEADLVSSELGRERYADAIAAGVLAFLGR